MAAFPGILAMPGVLMNSFLGLRTDRSIPVASQESLTVIAPMYNEEHGARRCLASILRQEVQPDQLAISINGGSDNTYAVVTRILTEYGYSRKATDMLEGLDARLERWLAPGGAASIVLVNYRSRTAKSESINNLFDYRLISSDRVLLVDGDTILHPGFVRAMRQNFYRLRTTTVDGRRRHVIEDYALVSGSVSSWLPHGAPVWQRIVSSGRRAEYAFSTLLRKGQSSQPGSSAVFGNSRLFTVVGCGFTARRELFPMPDTTRTEDHEFTLEVQNMPLTEVEVEPAALDTMGLRLQIAGNLVRPSELFGPDEQVILRTGGNARFVPEALMLTEDPSSLNGLLNQVERWNGGGLEGALGRIGRKLRPNVAFTVWLAQIENLLGIILLLFVLPNLIALNVVNPSIGMSGAALLTWFAIDLVLSFLLNTAGFRLQKLARGGPRRGALGWALRQSFMTLPAYLLIRYLNPFAWAGAATEVIPAWIRRHRHRNSSTVKSAAVAWERPRGARASLRTQGVMVSVLGLYPLLSGLVVAPVINPVNATGWQLTYARNVIDMDDHRSTGPLLPPEQGGVPTYCEAGAPGVVQLTLAGSAGVGYTPLGLWDLLALGRLAPLLPLIEQAADSYGLSVTDVLQVFMNESLFDPLAHGPTGDLGLAQLTTDALTLLDAASNDPKSPIYNPDLITVTSNVFDPVFSACAGAAKLAWAYDQPRVRNLEQAYALYINPVHGFVNGRIGDIWIPLVAQMEALEPNIQRLAAAYAQYQLDPQVLTQHERSLIEISLQVADSSIDLRTAYSQSLEVISDAQIDDRDVYRQVLNQLFGSTLAAQAR